MERKNKIKEKDSLKLYGDLISLNNELDEAFKSNYDRCLPFAENVFDRWERARKLGFGDGSSIYNSSIIIGELKVGKNCWIGPNTIIDASGGLEIGDYCTISSGVHIYTHDNVMQTLSSGKRTIERDKVTIGDNVYIGPNSILIKGLSIGSYCVIGTSSFVKESIKDFSIVVGQPARLIGKVEIDGENINLKYFK